MKVLLAHWSFINLNCKVCLLFLLIIRMSISSSSSSSSRRLKIQVENHLLFCNRSSKVLDQIFCEKEYEILRTKNSNSRIYIQTSLMFNSITRCNSIKSNSNSIITRFYSITHRIINNNRCKLHNLSNSIQMATLKISETFNMSSTTWITTTKITTNSTRY